MRRAWVIAAAAAVIVVATAGPASAHVEVQPAEAAAGQPASFAFRVPNEESSANTVTLVVRFPPNHPVPGVVATAPDGWTATIATRPLPAPVTVGGTTVTDTVDAITWRGSLPPGRAEYFPVTTGPLPTDTGELVFDATQTYDNGDVVLWNQLETNSTIDPPHPAPVLRLTGASVPPPSTVATAHDHATAADATTSTSGGSSSGVLVLGAVAAAVVVIVAVTAVLYRRTGRPSAPTGRRPGAG